MAAKCKVSRCPFRLGFARLYLPGQQLRHLGAAVLSAPGYRERCDAMSRTRTVVSMFVGVAAPVWGLAPIASLLPMSPSFPERWYSMHVWSWMAILWASSFLVLFAGLTWLGERAAPFISVICTVSFGLPAIALGPFPNLTRPPLTTERVPPALPGRQ